MSEERYTDYDEVLYPGLCYPSTHPDHLATLAYLFGLDPRPIHRCRVLEIGCGDGANLIPMAFGLPQSEFLGIDLAGRPIAEGQDFIQKLGLKNISLRKLNLMEFSEGQGSFDYVIAHGIYSWVPPPVQDSLLQVCRASLSPDGVAYVSYNAYPGFYIRQMLREMMLFHVHQAPDPRTRLTQAQTLCQLLKSARVRSNELDLLLKEELTSIQQRHPACLYHDDLADVNRPVYFHEFVEHAGRHGLQYLAEAEYPMTQDADLTDPAREALRSLGDNRLLKEQYLDFVRCRRFRQTLLCRQEAPVQSQAVRERVRFLRASSSASPAPPAVDMDPAVEATFRGANDATMMCRHPVAKAAMLVLIDAWPRSLAYGELVAGIGDRLGVTPPDWNEDLAAEFLLASYRLGVLQLHSYEPRYSLEPGAQPTVSPVARLQVGKGDLVTNLLHLAVRFTNENEKRVIRKLDGTRTLDDLARELDKEGGEAVDLDAFLKELGRLALLL